MLEINKETSEQISLILEIVKKVSESNLSLELPLALLSPSIYLNTNRGDIEEWGDSVLSEIFTQTIISESVDYFCDGEEIVDILKEKSISFYEYLVEVAEEFFSYSMEDGDIDIEEKDAYVAGYFDELSVGKVTFKSSLFTRDAFNDISMGFSIPFFVVSRYELEYDFFISTEVDENLNFTIWCLKSDREEFKSALTAYIDKKDAYKNLAVLATNRNIKIA